MDSARSGGKRRRMAGNLEKPRGTVGPQKTIKQGRRCPIKGARRTGRISSVDHNEGALSWLTSLSTPPPVSVFRIPSARSRRVSRRWLLMRPSDPRNPMSSQARRPLACRRRRSVRAPRRHPWRRLRSRLRSRIPIRPRCRHRFRPDPDRRCTTPGRPTTPHVLSSSSPVARTSARGSRGWRTPFVTPSPDSCEAARPTARPCANCSPCSRSSAPSCATRSSRRETVAR